MTLKVWDTDPWSYEKLRFSIFLIFGQGQDYFETLFRLQNS